LASLQHYLDERRSQFEIQLDATLQPRAGCPDALLKAMRYSLLAPGKRLRPLLVVMAQEACQRGNDSRPWPAACAVEMIHAYSLIHDDLPAMDDDDLRRGQPTCHRKFGEAMAILAGDALQTLAFEVVAEGYKASTAAACCLELARASGAAGMVGGQVDDLAWEGRLPATGRGAELRTVDDLEALHDRKTGALFRASLKLGVLVAYEGKPPHELLARFDAYGRYLGLAFQIIDDLLDVEGDAGSTGKRVQKDAARGKLTYPGFLGVPESRARAGWLCQEARVQLSPLGPAVHRLLELVSFVLERDR
jgi:geranylgeranyl diphosphate synthase, type II